MNDIIQQILNLFTSNADSNQITEDLIKVSVEISCNVVNYPTNDEFDKLLILLNQRDNLHVSFVVDENTSNYSSLEGSYFEQFVSDYKKLLNNENNFNLIITIEKRKKDGFLSIYYIDKFVEYLNSLPFVGQLSTFSKALDDLGIIIFEVQDIYFQEFSTEIIRFVAKDTNLILNYNINENLNNLNKTKNLCHCNLISKYNFIPENFYLINKSNAPLVELFERISLMYSAIFLLDIVNVNGNVIDY